jgi:hypothetical protein
MLLAWMLALMYVLAFPPEALAYPNCADGPMQVDPNCANPYDCIQACICAAGYGSQACWYQYCPGDESGYDACVEAQYAQLDPCEEQCCFFC